MVGAALAYAALQQAHASLPVQSVQTHRPTVDHTIFPSHELITLGYAAVLAQPLFGWEATSCTAIC